MGLAATSLERRLLEHIKTSKAITFRDFMAAALYDPELGYYNTARPKIGPQGDYYTASNIDEVFGAVLAHALAALLDEVEAGTGASRLKLVELGGGTGQLAGDILTALRREHPRRFELLDYVLVEKSPAMIGLQESRLGCFGETVAWLGLEELAHASGVFFSNELLDAMPVHRCRLWRGRIEEQYVDVDRERPDSALCLNWGEPSTPRIEEYLYRMRAALSEGQVFEAGLDALDWLVDAARSIDRGFLVTIDYGDTVNLLWGHDRADGTVRSFREHRLVESPIERPGEQDITSSVNFTALIEFGREAGLETVSYERQSAFLIRNGLIERVGAAKDLKARLAAKNLFVPGGASDNFRVLIQRRVANALSP